MRAKKNGLALRVLSTAALMAMVSSIAATAFADTYYVDYGDIKVDGSSINYYDASGSSQTNEHDEDIVITNNNKDVSTSHTVTINASEGSTADVTLKDVNIDTSSEDKAAVTVTGNGTTSIELDGKNTLTSGGTHAGLEKNDAEGTGNLVIRDDTKDGGSLKATGGSEDDVGGAGIGSSCGNDTSHIEIASGKVEAVGGQNAAGIGSGSSTRTGGDAKQIKISGGDVTAVGCGQGAGIGSSNCGAAEIEISGGKVSAEVVRDQGYDCVDGAGIGGGSRSGDVSVKITGGTVNAKTKDRAAAIGGGYRADETLDISISGDDTYVNAETTGWGSGIGGGQEDMSTSTIKISGGTVIASGDSGIGTGDNAQWADTTIEISGGNVTASGLAGIGTGGQSHESNMKIKISGGNVTATAAIESAAIGMGPDTREDHVEVELTGGNITALGGTSGAAAIGGGIQRWGSTTDVAVKIGGSANPLKLVAKSQGGNEGTIGKGAVDDGKPDHNSVNFDEVQNMTADTLGEDGGILVELYNNYDPKTGTGTRYKCIHNRAYVGYPADADINEAHAWDEGVIVEQAAPGKPGTIRYTCTVDGCGATKEVSYDYVEPGEKQLREVGVIFWDAAAQAAPAALQGRVFSAEEQTTTAARAQVESLLADKANWKLAENVGDLKIHPAADAAGTVYEQAVKASGCQYYVVANVTAQ